MTMEMKMSKDIPFVGDKLPKLRAAAVQTAPVFLDREATIDKIAIKVKEAKDNGADLVVPLFLPSRYGASLCRR